MALSTSSRSRVTVYHCYTHWAPTMWTIQLCSCSTLTAGFTFMSMLNNCRSSFLQPLMATPKGAGPPQPSFFHTPVPLSPLAAVVPASPHMTTKTVYIPQRKLDVSTEDPWEGLVGGGLLSVYSIPGLWAFAALTSVYLSQSDNHRCRVQCGAGRVWCGIKIVNLMAGKLFSYGLRYSCENSINKWPVTEVNFLPVFKRKQVGWRWLTVI